MSIEDIKKDMEKKINKIKENTQKDVQLHFEDFNTIYITLDNKKFDFLLPREMQAFINGMYFILK